MIQRYKAVLRDTRDGHVATYEYGPCDTTDKALIFSWTENNYSCDCNRSLCMYPYDDSKHLECGSGNNLIELVELWADGVKLI